jgi:hypothetical protein
VLQQRSAGSWRIRKLHTEQTNERSLIQPLKSKPGPLYNSNWYAGISKANIEIPLSLQLAVVYLAKQKHEEAYRCTSGSSWGSMPAADCSKESKDGDCPLYLTPTSAQMSTKKWNKATMAHCISVPGCKIRDDKSDYLTTSDSWTGFLVSYYLAWLIARPTLFIWYLIHHERVE